MKTENTKNRMGNDKKKTINSLIFLSCLAGLILVGLLIFIIGLLNTLIVLFFGSVAFAIWLFLYWVIDSLDKLNDPY